MEVEATFVSRSDGRFKLEDRNSHLAASQGVSFDMGPSAVIRVGEGITVLLTSRKTPPFDLGQLRSQGIVPEELSFIGVKAAVAHRRAYHPISAKSYTVTNHDVLNSVGMLGLAADHAAFDIVADGNGGNRGVLDGRRSSSLAVRIATRFWLACFSSTHLESGGHVTLEAALPRRPRSSGRSSRTPGDG